MKEINNRENGSKYSKWNRLEPSKLMEMVSSDGKKLEMTEENEYDQT